MSNWKQQRTIKLIKTQLTQKCAPSLFLISEGCTSEKIWPHQGKGQGNHVRGVCAHRPIAKLPRHCFQTCSNAGHPPSLTQFAGDLPDWIVGQVHIHCCRGKCHRVRLAYTKAVLSVEGIVWCKASLYGSVLWCAALFVVFGYGSIREAWKCFRIDQHSEK